VRLKKNQLSRLHRHTFETTGTYTNGVPIESVSKMLCNKKLRNMQYYAKELNTKLRDDMKALKNKFSTFCLVAYSCF